MKENEKDKRSDPDRPTIICMWCGEETLDGYHEGGTMVPWENSDVPGAMRCKEMPDVHPRAIVGIMLGAGSPEDFCALCGSWLALDETHDDHCSQEAHV